MRTRQKRRQTTPMSEIYCTLVLTIEPASTPITGTVQDPTGPPIPFVGYVQLIAELERYRQTETGAGAPRGSPPEEGSTTITRHQEDT
jgi:hypothetical protein